MVDISFRVGEVVWRELICPDVSQARLFYGELFGWTFVETTSTTEPTPGNQVPVAYTMIKTGDATIGGMLKLPEPAPPPHWMSYVSVADVDDTFAKVASAGGELIHGPVDVEAGRFVIFKDPTGAPITAFRSKKGDAPVSHPPPLHSFCWETLSSSDPDRAVAFYSAVFGWKKMEVPEGDALVLGTGKSMVCDVQKTQGVAPSRFVTHVLVADLEATRDRLLRLGGKVLMLEVPVPGFGKLAVVTDPFGVEFSLFEPGPMS